MSFFSNLIKDVAPVVATVAPFIPGGQAVAAVASVKATADQQAAARYQQNLAIDNYNRSMREMQNLDAFGGPGRPINTTMTAAPTSSPGFFSTLSAGLKETGGFINDLFGSGIPALFGINRPGVPVQQPAVTTPTIDRPQETSTSGTVDAGVGSLLAPVFTGVGKLLKSPLGQLTLGTGAGLALSGGDGQRTPRITRKMKSQARMVLNMTGGNLPTAAEILGISQDVLVFILLKRFRNDGPVVTKAALRKTKQTIRRLHNMQDVLKSITPTAAGRRRAPVRRATTTTLIKN